MTPRILIVEDNRTIARELEIRLVRLGFAVAGVTAFGEHAVEIAARERPDLVLMDIRLEGPMDGITAAAHIRAARAVPIVFLTGFDDDDTLRAACGSEAFGYIVKPAGSRELQIVLEMALYKHAAEQTRQRLELQLRRAEKMDAIGLLAGGIAHDFNNVLMAILSQCRALLPQLPEVAEAHAPHQRVASIQAAAERGARMTRQLLAFGRDDADQPIAIDLALHVQRTCAMLAHLLGDAVTIEIALAPGLRAVLGHGSEIEQIVMNLVLNARDAMPRGGTVMISARDVPGADEVVLVVRDTGVGMDDATRARVFEPFFTTKDIGAGTGLGLATVYAVVQRSRGRIEVASTPGRGTTFTIWLPTTAVPVAPHVVCDEPIQRIDGTLVLVEDDPQVRTVIRDILEQAGMRVIEASDGVEALRVCRAQPGQIDLVLSDVMMPRLGGAELARSLAADAPGTKIIYMSGYPGRGVSGGRAELGMILQKPFTPDELLERIRDALRSRAA